MLTLSLWCKVWSPAAHDEPNVTDTAGQEEFQRSIKIPQVPQPLISRRSSSPFPVEKEGYPTLAWLP